MSLHSDSRLDAEVGKDIDTFHMIELHNRRKHTRLEICERVYRKCCNRIRHAMENYGVECEYYVPEVQLWGGVARYQVNMVVGYILIRLHDKGLQVRWLRPNGIYVSWRKMVGKAVRENDAIRTVRYPLDEPPQYSAPAYSAPAYSQPQLASVSASASASDTPKERLLHAGCHGDCCKDAMAQRAPQRITRKKRLAMERNVTQSKIRALIQRSGGV